MKKPKGLGGKYMDAIWVVSLTILIAFCLFISFGFGFGRGYKTGATKVLNEWKKHIREMEDNGDE